MAARINDVCDAVVSTLQAAWTLAGISPTPTVSRDYVPDFPAEDMTALSGVHVFVFPSGYGFNELSNRGEYLNDRRVVVLIVERFTDAGNPSKSWVDALVDFVEKQVYDVIGDQRKTFLLGTLWPDAAEVSVVYDPEELQERKLFWSEVAITYQEIG